jgi:hypothetical protein
MRAYKASVPPAEGVHDRETAVSDAELVAAALRRAEAAREVDAMATAKVNAFDLAEALMRSAEEPPPRKESGTRLVAVRPEETTYARAPADSAEEVFDVPEIQVATPVPPPPVRAPRADVDVTVVAGIVLGALAAIAVSALFQ